MDHPPTLLRKRNVPHVWKTPGWSPTADGGEQLEFSTQIVVGQGDDREVWNENRFVHYCPMLHHFSAELVHTPKLLGYRTARRIHVVLMELVAHNPRQLIGPSGKGTSLASWKTSTKNDSCTAI
jgi:hypothetical protein